MEDLERHEMHLDRTHPSGAEEWYCPTCGRRFLMRWPPSYSKIVLEPGDEYAIHSGGKGGVAMATAELAQAPLASIAEPGVAMEFLAAQPEPELSDALLEPWRRFLDAQQDSSGEDIA